MSRPRPPRPPARRSARSRRAAPSTGEDAAGGARPAPPKGALAPGGFPAAELPGVVKFAEPLSRHTTFRIGGRAAVHFQPATAESVAGAVAWAREREVPWLVLGLGSNVLIKDSGFPGLVIKIGKGLDTLTHRADTWRVGAGLPTPILAKRTGEASFSGIHRLIGVPGTVGGGVYMNAGAHGNDFASVLRSATVLEPSGEVVERPRAEIPFSYRRSGLGQSVVLGCVLGLERADPERLTREAGELLRRRREGTPFDQPCCGSVFKNPPQETTAGRLIDRCGLKGRRFGGAQISPKHANYIVNLGNASADDVLKLIDIARTAVLREFGIELELEVKVIG